MSEVPPRVPPPPLHTLEAARAYFLELEGVLRAATLDVLGGGGNLHKSLRRQWVARGRVLGAMSLLATRWPELVNLGTFDAKAQSMLALPSMPASDRSSVQAWLPLVVQALRQMRALCNVPAHAFASTRVVDQQMAERSYLTCLGVVLESLRLWTATGVLDQVGYETATHEVIQTRIPTLVGTLVQGRLVS